MLAIGDFDVYTYFLFGFYCAVQSCPLVDLYSDQLVCSVFVILIASHMSCSLFEYTYLAISDSHDYKI